MSIGNVLKLALLAGMLTISGMAQAQRPARTPEDRADRQTRWMQKNLALTPEQNQKVYNAVLAHARDMQDLKNQPRGGQRRAGVADAQQQFDHDMQLILTADQYKGYKAHMEDMKARAQERKRRNMLPEGAY